MNLIGWKSRDRPKCGKCASVRGRHSEEKWEPPRLNSLSPLASVFVPKPGRFGGTTGGPGAMFRRVQELLNRVRGTSYGGVEFLIRFPTVA